LKHNNGSSYKVIIVFFRVILDYKKYISVNQTIIQQVNDENSSKDFCPKAGV